MAEIAWEFEIAYGCGHGLGYRGINLQTLWVKRHRMARTVAAAVGGCDPVRVESKSAVISPKLTSRAMAHLPLFKGIGSECLSRLCEELPTQVTDTGDTVVCEGEMSTALFVVVGGELEVVKATESGSTARVAMFGPGDWFGEMSVIDVAPRSATVRALAPTTLIVIEADTLRTKLKEADSVAYGQFMENVALGLARRLRVADGIVAHLMATVTDAYVHGHTDHSQLKPT